MKMVDLFSLTLRVIVYIPNLHAGGEAMQVRERGGGGGGGVLEKAAPPKKKPTLLSWKSHINSSCDCVFFLFPLMKRQDTNTLSL